MSLNVDDDEEKPTAQHPSIPLDLSGNDITWDQNFANVLGRISHMWYLLNRLGDPPVRHKKAKSDGDRIKGGARMQEQS